MRTGMKKNPKLMKQTSKFGYPNDKGSSQAQRVLFLVSASIQINGCLSHNCTLRNSKHQVGSDCMAYHTKHLLQHQKSDRRIPCVMGEQCIACSPCVNGRTVESHCGGVAADEWIYWHHIGKTAG